MLFFDAVVSFCTASTSVKSSSVKASENPRMKIPERVSTSLITEVSVRPLVTLSVSLSAADTESVLSRL